MKLRVSHVSHYEYDQLVGFAPHLLYLRPREGAAQRLRSYHLNVTPSAKLSHVRDPHDNPLTWAHLWDRARSLTIRTEAEVETLEHNPFDFILKPYAIRFPFAYEPVFSFALQPYLVPPFEETQSALRAWLDENFRDRPSETVPLVTALNTLVYSRFTYGRRDERGIQPSLTTLRLGTGSCRDFAVLLCEILRTLGLAARFVSGYHYAPPDDDRRSVGSMHAWVEVYLPGAGWRGIDPTNGIFCTDAFIPVAHAAQAESVNPVQGGVACNSPVQSTLHVNVTVDRLD